MVRSWVWIVFLCVVVIQIEASHTITQEEIDKNRDNLTRKFLTALCVIAVPHLTAVAAIGWIIFSTRGHEKEAEKFAAKLPELRAECDGLRQYYWRALREERLYVQRNHEYENRQSYFKRATGRGHHTQHDSPFDEEAAVGGHTTITRRKPENETKRKDEAQSPWEGNEASQLMKSKTNKTETVAKSRHPNDPFNNDD
ncbi:hypothetical protein M3Y95_00869400 [Aphelenchoides besseyi]|nr:hypothetical protein M3Y95_00869400 [Aphelenchoides besseyi]